MFWFAKSDNPIFGRCIEQQSVLLNRVRQNWMVRFLKLEGPELLGLQMNQVKQLLAVIKCIYLPPTYLHFIQDI
jgi:hypothetical protein